MPFSKEMILGSSGNQGAAGFFSYQIEQSCYFDVSYNVWIRRIYWNNKKWDEKDSNSVYCDVIDQWCICKWKSMFVVSS